MKCKMCGAQMRGRIDKQFCDQNCRKAWSRRIDAVKQSLRQALAACDEIARVAQEHPDLWWQCRDATHAISHAAGRASVVAANAGFAVSKRDSRRRHTSSGENA